jgi:Flp pilus assembly pilin Flp
MLVSLWGPRPELPREINQDDVPREGGHGRQPRRGATALEYLVCISTILAVVIMTVQQLGGMVGNMFHNNAKATEKTVHTGP